MGNSMGQLQRCLVRGEYGQMQESCLLFESNFLQVTKSGDVASRVTLGIAATSPHLELPDLLLLARPVLMPTGGPCCSLCGQWLPLPEEELQLFALLPLRFVQLSVYDKLRHRLEVRLASGRTFYVQLQAPPTQLERVFEQWVRLLERLRYQRPGAWDSAPGCRNQGPPCLGHSMGQLQRCLASGEYGQLLQECLLFESDFLQVTESGDVASRVTLGIAATSPHLGLPDLLLLARPVLMPTGGPCCSRCGQWLPLPEEELELFALLPLRFVRLSVQDELWHRLEVRLASGRTFYLELLAPPTQLEQVFGQWVRLLYRLRPSPEGEP